ncbi:SET domain-containing protein 4 [Actinomortierella wolfii]|nr:SET domain-containing protein 4 [Actinomortierella wolfii]
MSHQRASERRPVKRPKHDMPPVAKPAPVLKQTASFTAGIPTPPSTSGLLSRRDSFPFRSKRTKPRLGRTARTRAAKKNSAATSGPFGGHADNSNVEYDKQYFEFLRWLKEQGCPKTKLTLAEFSNTGRGMMATKDIKAGEVIVQVPETNLVTMKGLQPVYGSRISRFGKKIGSHMFIALHIALLVQMSEKSGWLPYLQMLPTKFDTMPVRYPPELYELLPPSAKNHVTKQKQKIMNDYKLALEFLQANNDLLSKPLTYEEYEWAWLVVNTRCIYLDAKKQDNADNIALAPMLDFLNHTHEAKEYGFVTPMNPYNYVSVDHAFMNLVIPGESAAAKKEKLELLDMAGYLGDYVLHKDDVSFRLLAGLRLRLINPFNTSSAATQLAISRWHSVVNGELEQVSDENERLVRVYLEKLCDDILADTKKSLAALARMKTTFPVMHLQQVWIETRDIVLSIVDKIHRNEEL